MRWQLAGNKGLRQDWAARSKNIRKVIASEHNLGALEGMGIGVLVGVLIPALAIRGETAGGESATGNGLAVVTSIAVGGILGTVWGAISGHSYVYEFIWFTRRLPSEIDNKEQPKEK